MYVNHHPPNHPTNENNNNEHNRTRLALQKSACGTKGRPHYKGIAHGIYTIAKEEGVARLYRGLLPRLLRVPPGMAITWCVVVLLFCVCMYVCVCVVAGTGFCGGMTCTDIYLYIYTPPTHNDNYIPGAWPTRLCRRTRGSSRPRPASRFNINKLGWIFDWI